MSAAVSARNRYIDPTNPAHAPTSSRPAYPSAQSSNSLIISGQSGAYPSSTSSMPSLRSKNTSTASTTVVQPQPSTSYRTSTTSTRNAPTRQQPKRNGYKVETTKSKKDGKVKEVIVLDSDDDEDTKADGTDSTASSSIQSVPAKKRKVNGGKATVAATTYQPVASTSSTIAVPRKIAASGVGGKRKQVDQSGPSHKVSRKDAVPVQQTCDDKEGHFIVRSGEYLSDGRYKIERLLGQGTFGKVVEAYDKRTQNWVAVKIIRSIQKYRDASRVEIKVLNLLRERDPNNENNCIHLVDCFDDRNHICIVTELLSVSVFDFLKDNNYAPFPSSHIQHFAKQLLSSVAFLHDLRLVHTDLKPENILLVDNEFTSLEIPNSTDKGKRVLNNSAIRLIDFGSATFDEDYHATVVSTRHYRAPEIILGLGWSFPCDVWSIGCILVEFYTGEALFQTHDNLEHLAMMEVVFGKMPDRYARLASRSKPEWFRQTRLDFPQSDTSRQSQKFVRQMKTLNDIIPATSITNSRFQDLLMKLLTWDPAQRITVREALRHPFFSLDIQDEGSLR